MVSYDVANLALNFSIFVLPLICAIIATLTLAIKFMSTRSNPIIKKIDTAK